MVNQRIVKKQSGVALVPVLLITALVAALAIEFHYDFMLNMSRVGNRWSGAQAHQYLLGAESLAALVLEQDLENESDTDDLTEDWAQEVPPFPTDHGFLEARIEDAQSRFNINNLRDKVDLDPSQPVVNDAQRFTAVQRFFIRLLQTFEGEEIEVTEQEAIAITEAIIDWLDEDDEVMGFGGAESLFYNSADPSYQPGNQLMSSVSELRLVKNMTPELYVALEPYLMALPGNTNLNVNTAPARLFRAINDVEDLTPLEAVDVEDIVTDRELQPFDTINGFFENPVVTGLMTNPDRLDANLGVASDFFILHAKASVGEDHIRFLDSVIYRNDEGKARAYHRRYTSY